jgi:hypothetical protein
MPEVRNDRLSLDARGLILSLVKTENAQSERKDTVNNFTHPTIGQLYALERNARRERSKAQAQLIAAAVTAAKALFARLAAYSRIGSSASDIQRQVAHHA